MTDCEYHGSGDLTIIRENNATQSVRCALCGKTWYSSNMAEAWNSAISDVKNDEQAEKEARSGRFVVRQLFQKYNSQWIKEKKRK